MEQVYQSWWRTYQEINVFTRFEYNVFCILYPFVTYLLTLPLTWIVSCWRMVREQSQWSAHAAFWRKLIVDICCFNQEGLNDTVLMMFWWEQIVLWKGTLFLLHCLFTLKWELCYWLLIMEKDVVTVCFKAELENSQDGQCDSLVTKIYISRMHRSAANHITVLNKWTCNQIDHIW
jgi:hypothetical protein